MNNGTNDNKKEQTGSTYSSAYLLYQPRFPQKASFVRDLFYSVVSSVFQRITLHMAESPTTI